MDEVLSSRFSVNNETTTSTDANNNKKKVGWRRIDWKQEEEQDISYPAPPPSPVDVVMIRDRLVHIKRDDQVSSINCFVTLSYHIRVINR